MRRFSKTNLSTQLVVMTMILFAIAISALSAFNYSQQLKYETKRQVFQVNIVTRNISSLISEKIWEESYTDIEYALLDSIKFEVVNHIIVTDKAGHVLSEVVKNGDEVSVVYKNRIVVTPDSNYEEHVTSGDSIIVWRKIIYANNHIGWLHLDINNSLLKRTAWLAIRNNVLVNLAVYILTILVLLTITNKKLSYLSTVSRFARNMKNNAGRSLEIKSVSREVDDLVKNINQMSKNLAQKKDNFLSLAENMMDGLLVNLDGRHVFANASLAKMLGYDDASELLGTTIEDVIYPGELTRVLELHQARIRGENVPNQYETIFKSKNGEPLPVELNATMTQWEGRLTGMVSIRDISKRKQTEAELLQHKNHLEELVTKRNIELLESEKKFRTLFESSSDAIMTLDAEAFIDCNQATLDMFGANSKDDFLGKHPGDISPPTQPDGVLSHVAADEKITTAFNTGKNYFEWTHRRHNGDDFPAEVLLTPMELEGKKVLQAVVRDITKRKQVEAALQESEQRFRLMADQAPALIWMSDTDNMRTWYNKHWLEYTGRTMEQELGAGWLDGVYPDDIKEYNSLCHTALNNRQSFEMEFRLLKADGAYGWIVDTGIPRFDDSANFVGYIGYCWDITSRKRAEENLVSAKEEAERANRTKSEFLSRVSHELRTPLNAILGFGQLLQASSDNLSQAQTEGIDCIVSGGKHLLYLIDELLDITNIHAGKFDIAISEVSVHDSIDASLALTRQLSEKYRVTIVAEKIDDVYIFAEPKRLTQVLINLISNAIKYNKENGRVEISTSINEHGNVRISVVDTGIGIAPHEREKIFEPFRRMDGSASTIEGTGLGLTITKELVDLMQGNLDFISAPGKGSTFWVEFPVADKVIKPSSIGDGSHARNNLSQPGKITVLYIEDSEDNLILMKHVVGKLPNCRLLTATTAKEGIDITRAQLPDLILMDISLPGMDGYEALAVIKADQRIAHIPVIAISANVMPEQVEQGILAGFVDYICKPIDIIHLTQAIDKFCRLRGDSNDSEVDRHSGNSHPAG